MAIYQGGKKVGVVIPVAMNGEYNIEQVIEGDDCTLNITTAGIPKPDKPDQSKTVTPSTSSQVVVADPGYELVSVTVDAVTSSIDSNIKAENIKKDVTILGVTGTLEPGVDGYSVNSILLEDGTQELQIKGTDKFSLQSKIATPETVRQLITFDSGYDGLSSVEIAAVTSNIDRNIVNYNIKKDVTILGVTGTLEGGESIKFIQSVEGSVSELTSDDLAGVSCIRDRAFYGVTSLTSLSVPDSAEYIGQYAFYQCSNLRTVNIGSGVSEIKAGAFYECNSLESINVPGNVSIIGNDAFYRCGQLSTVTFNEGLTDIQIEAFRDTPVYDIIFPNTLTGIGNYAFQNCTNLRSILLGSGLVNIYRGAFIGCRSLTELIIPDNVLNIGTSAFSYCNSLRSVTIGTGMGAIYPQAFENCTALTEITIKATTPPTLSNANSIPSNVTTIYIPAGTLSAYQTATNWSSFASKFVEMEA